MRNLSIVKLCSNLLETTNSRNELNYLHLSPDGFLEITNAIFLLKIKVMDKQEKSYLLEIKPLREKRRFKECNSIYDGIPAITSLDMIYPNTKKIELRRDNKDYETVKLSGDINIDIHKIISISNICFNVEYLQKLYKEIKKNKIILSRLELNYSKKSVNLPFHLMGEMDDCSFEYILMPIFQEQ